MKFNINRSQGSGSLDRRVRKKVDFSSYMVYIIFVIVLLIFAIWLGHRFFSVNNMLNITRQTAMISVMAVAMTFVIASGQIDLSVGSTAALGALIVAIMLQATHNVLLSVVVALAVGAVIGLLNGFFVTAIGIPSFLVTLGMAGIIRGAAMWTTNTSAVPIFNNTFNYIFGLGNVFGIPILFIWTIVALVIGNFALTNMSYGKKVLAVGANVVSAKFTGVNVRRITTIVIMISSLSATFAGILYAGRMETARYTFGEGDELSVIAAVILGGTSMAGGNGTVIGAVVGSLLMGMINNGLIIGGLSVPQQMIVRGAIIIFAVALYNVGKKNKL